MGVAAALRHLPVIGKCFPASRAVRARVGAQPPSRSRLPRASRGGKHLPMTGRSEEHKSELQSLMRISYAVFCLKKKKHDYHIIVMYNHQHSDIHRIYE